MPKPEKTRTLKTPAERAIAEPYTFPGYMTRCGHGWTTERAINDLLRHEAECRANDERTTEDA